MSMVGFIVTSARETSCCIARKRQSRSLTGSTRNRWTNQGPSRYVNRNFLVDIDSDSIPSQGTEDVMAVEVMHQRYLFSKQYIVIKTKARKEERRKVGDWVNGKVKDDPRIKSTYDPLEYIAAPLWSYNPLHDMESIFWICLSYVLYKDVYCDPLPPNRHKAPVESEEEREQRLRAHYSFRHDLLDARGYRSLVMTAHDLLPRHLSAHPLHSVITPFSSLLVALREILVERFRAVECSDEPITNMRADAVYGVFIQQFRIALLYLQNIGCDVHVGSLQKEIEILNALSNSASSKRTRSEDEDDSDSHISNSLRSQLE